MYFKLFEKHQLSKKSLKEINACGTPDCGENAVWNDKMKECVPIEGNSSGQACQDP